ncbi:hypothetical protein NDU88_006368 [Pleurodeles waltl]|uniref:Uncharacterized protein n=1 Tax=Pleurodeles waltl TaxID=8319 RepID=A0AAV7MYZ4_PLEWA|nr:hypothetical protein NDU88_006368 [Pleurodeles waltl]
MMERRVEDDVGDGVDGEDSADNGAADGEDSADNGAADDDRTVLSKRKRKPPSWLKDYVVEGKENAYIA